MLFICLLSSILSTFITFNNLKGTIIQEVRTFSEFLNNKNLINNKSKSTLINFEFLLDELHKKLEANSSKIFSLCAVVKEGRMREYVDQVIANFHEVKNYITNNNILIGDIPELIIGLYQKIEILSKKIFSEYDLKTPLPLNELSASGTNYLQSSLVGENSGYLNHLSAAGNSGTQLYEFGSGN